MAVQAAFLTLAFLTLACSQWSAMAIMLHESPYFVRNVSNVAYSYPEDKFGGRAFRVMGIMQGTPVLSPLNWYQAEQACADVGMGLAAVANLERKQALDSALLAAEQNLPADEPFVWIGGYRTGLSDPKCIGPGVPVTIYPYFIEYQDETYKGCGRHEYHDWAWARPSADGSFDDADKVFIPWRDNRGPEEYWDKYERTGLDKNDEQPTGWTGPKNLGEFPDGGLYENCTVAQILTADNPSVNEAARGHAYYDDYGCYAVQTRWVCEFEDPDRSVDEAALAERGPDAIVTASPFFIPGVTSEVRSANDDTHYRVFGIPPDRVALVKSTDPIAFSWDGALQACRNAGGTNLATSPGSTYSEPRSALMEVVADVLFDKYGETSFSVWLGGATTVAANTTGAALEHTDFSWYGNNETEMLEPLHRQWTHGWPKGGPKYVGPPEGDEGFTSCMVSVWDPSTETDDRWQNVLCKADGVKYFMCQFPTKETGIAVVTPPGVESADPGTSTLGAPGGVDGDEDDEQTSTGAIVGGVAGVALALLVLAGIAAVFVRRRRNSKRSSKRNATTYQPSIGAALPVTYMNAKSKSSLSAAGSGGGGAALKYLAPTSSNPFCVELSDRDVMVPSCHDITVSADRPATQRGGPGSARWPGRAGVPPPLFAMSSVPTSLSTRMQGVQDTHTYGDSYTWNDTVSHVTVPSFVADSTMGAQGQCTNIGATTGAITETPLARLNRQLDSIISAGGVFAKKYVLTDSADRREGGQGVVQFARGRFNGFEYAIKFFVSSRAYATERALYELPMLHRILPSIEDVADPANPERDHVGQPLPPYIVMERGEALDEWSRRAKPDMPTSVTVLSHLANRLAELHAAGMCHRDLKPANVMWLPRENRWTIIDYGCVANIGTEAPLAYSASYTAPEVIAAVDALQAGRGTHMMVVTAALDAWSVGVMAFEMLTTEPNETKRRLKISVEQLRGEQSLPWEGENLTKDVKRRLGVLRKPVLQLLSRDPAARPSMASLKAQCGKIFTGNTTVESTTSMVSA